MDLPRGGKDNPVMDHQGMDYRGLVRPDAELDELLAKSHRLCQDSRSLHKYFRRLERVTAACQRMIAKERSKTRRVMYGLSAREPNFRTRAAQAEFDRPEKSSEVEPFFGQMGGKYLMNVFAGEIPVEVVGVDFTTLRVGVVSEVDGHTEWVEPSCLRSRDSRVA